jgi:hypothetical protein
MLSEIGDRKRNTLVAVTLAWLLVSIIAFVSADTQGFEGSSFSLSESSPARSGADDATTDRASEQKAARLGSSADAGDAAEQPQNDPANSATVEASQGTPAPSQPSAASGVTQPSTSAIAPTPSPSIGGQGGSSSGSGINPSPQPTTPPPTEPCPTSAPTATGSVTSFSQPPYDPNTPSTRQKYNVTGSVVVTNTGNRWVNVDLRGWVVTPLNEFGYNLYLGTMSIEPFGALTTNFTENWVSANNPADIVVRIRVDGYRYDC